MGCGNSKVNFVVNNDIEGQVIWIEMTHFLNLILTMLQGQSSLEVFMSIGLNLKDINKLFNAFKEIDADGSGLLRWICQLNASTWSSFGRIHTSSRVVHLLQSGVKRLREECLWCFWWRYDEHWCHDCNYSHLVNYHYQINLVCSISWSLFVACGISWHSVMLIWVFLHIWLKTQLVHWEYDVSLNSRTFLQWSWTFPFRCWRPRSDRNLPQEKNWRISSVEQSVCQFEEDLSLWDLFGWILQVDGREPHCHVPTAHSATETKEAAHWRELLGTHGRESQRESRVGQLRLHQAVADVGAQAKRRVQEQEDRRGSQAAERETTRSRRWRTVPQHGGPQGERTVRGV